MKTTRDLITAILVCCFCAFVDLSSVPAQSRDDGLSHLTIYSAGIGEFLEERSIDLQPGLNTIEWRSLMPKAYIRTVHILPDEAEILRQSVTYDGAQVNNEKSPVLHLVIQNRGAAGRKRVQVDYLAPGISWLSDFSLTLDPVAAGAPPTSAVLDSWVSLYNSTGVDLAAGKIDLVAGEIALLPEGGGSGDSSRYATQSQIANNYRIDGADVESNEESFTAVSGLSAFTRFALGDNIGINANASISRFPIFQHARLVIVQRNVFENSHDIQTVGRGGFILLPRGLEVRLVAKNTTSAPLAAGLVTIYQRTPELSQIVGQDRIAFTPQNGEFTVTQGRSATMFGTRRILERRVINYRDKDNNSHDKLVTRVEVVLSNRGPLAAEAFVRETIERYDDNQWKMIESTTPGDTLGANTIQFKVNVPAGGKTTITYLVENE